MIYQTSITSPVGTLQITATIDYITSILFRDQDEEQQENETLNPIIKDCITQLENYFNGELKHFTFPMAPEGTAFQKQVWSELQGINYGKTISYMQLSKNLGNPKAIRAIGTANGMNKIVIAIPCHRIIGSNGSLVGYSGQLWRKKWLLDHEAKFQHGVMKLF
ncbi:MAG: methylated-DNA--[protein]-cysteine S-methyltransferase [Ginsengibacter sp.]